MRLLWVSAVIFFAVPAVAWASGGASIVSRDLPVGGARTPAGAASSTGFDLVGFHWQGSGRVLFRTRAVSGRWTSWRPVAPEAEDLPDPRSTESKQRAGWRLGKIGRASWRGGVER